MEYIDHRWEGIEAHWIMQGADTEFQWTMFEVPVEVGGADRLCRFHQPMAGNRAFVIATASLCSPRHEQGPGATASFSASPNVVLPRGLRTLCLPVDYSEGEEEAVPPPSQNVVPPPSRRSRNASNASTHAGTDAALTALLHPSEGTALSRAIPTIELAVRALKLARNATSEGLSEITAAQDTLAEKYATWLGGHCFAWQYESSPGVYN
ncbi:hypothetical protein C8J57DRAFT_1227667 [Mycena rebaudengoi]|nr:hypothetical protein C8J57DRAFT_1227667 [Mycena rebaudengoi]